MRQSKIAIWVSIGVFSGLIASETAMAGSLPRRNGRATNEIHHDVHEIQNSRAELRRDLRELARDRTELRHDIRRGAPASEIFRDRVEIRESLWEIGGSRRDLQRDRIELRRDLDKYGCDNNPYERIGSGNRGYRWGWWGSDHRWERNFRYE